MKHRETMWAISFEWDSRHPQRRALYCGTYSTRQDAIAAHCRLGKRDWPERRKQGDRAVKVVIEWEE